jgi:DUF2993 family protein
MFTLRLVRWLLGPIAVLALAFVGANLVVDKVAEDRVADDVRDTFELDAKPTVRIDSFPLLITLARHDVSSVTITARNVVSGGLQLRTVRVALDHIAAGYEILSDTSADIRVRRARASARVSDSALNAYLARRGVDAEVELLKDQVFVLTSFQSQGRRHTIRAGGKLSVRRSTLQFDPGTVLVDGSRPPGSVAARARREAAFRVSLPRLPGAFVIGGVRLLPGVAAFSAEASPYIFHRTPGN